MDAVGCPTCCAGIARNRSFKVRPNLLNPKPFRGLSVGPWPKNPIAAIYLALLMNTTYMEGRITVSRPQRCLTPSAGGSYMSGPPRGASKDRKAWPDSIVVMQGTANPSTPVRFRLRPPFLAPKTPKIAHCLTCGLLCCGKAEGLLL